MDELIFRAEQATEHLQVSGFVIVMCMGYGGGERSQMRCVFRRNFIFAIELLAIAFHSFKTSITH